VRGGVVSAPALAICAPGACLWGEDGAVSAPCGVPRSRKFPGPGLTLTRRAIRAMPARTPAGVTAHTLGVNLVYNTTTQ
jgi:hypothetical protein